MMYYNNQRGEYPIMKVDVRYIKNCCIIFMLMFFSLNSIYPVDGENINFSNDQWIIEIIDLTSSHYIDMAIGLNDFLYISYYDRFLESLKVAFIEDDNTRIDIVDSEGKVGLYSSISIDSDNNVHVSYYDEYNGDLKYAYWSDNEWKIEIVDYIGNVGLFSCIDIDSQGYPHISYYDKTNGDLKYCYYSDAGWIIEIVEENGDIGLSTSLVIDSDDIPHISFTNKKEDSLYYTTKSLTNWMVDIVDNNCEIFGSTSIDVDKNNIPHIAYFDIGTYSEIWKLKYVYFDSPNWVIEIIDPDIKHFFQDWGVSISIDEFDRIHIGYYCWKRWDLKYAYKVNDRWIIENIEDVEYAAGAYASLVIDSFGYPYIAYSVNDLELRYAKKIQYSPDPPNMVSGPSIGRYGMSYMFTASGFDFDSDKIKIGFDWGDNSTVEWTDFVESGESVNVNHSWNENDNFDIRIKVVDENGYESLWSDPFIIRIYKQKSFNQFLRNILFLLERFPFQKPFSYFLY